MLSSSCRYGIRAVVYIASQCNEKGKTGIKQISKDLELPTPFLAKILQQLAKHKILISLKGPHGGFSLLKDPKKITVLEIIRIIDGEEVFTNCIMHNTSCTDLIKSKKHCHLHDDYAAKRTELLEMFRKRTVYDLVKKTEDAEKVLI